jgi:endonuclease/exonuclease/phosphatase family metal-dependent hydrolase
MTAKCALKGWLVLAVFALAGCGAPNHQRTGPLPPPITAETPLTVMSFNVRLGLGRADPNRDILRMQSQWGRNLDAVIDAIRSADPDIVGLQEVAGPGQLWNIAQALDMNHAYVGHKTGNSPALKRGVGILSKFPIVSSRGAALSENRNFVIATIDVGKKRISVASIHRSHLEFSEESIPFLMAELAKSQLPTLLVGDFNFPPNAKMLNAPGRKRLQPVLDRFLDTAAEARTSSAKFVREAGTWHGGGRVDYVFAEIGHFRVLDAGLVAAQHQQASDHVAYIAKVKFKN